LFARFQAFRFPFRVRARAPPSVAVSIISFAAQKIVCGCSPISGKKRRKTRFFQNVAGVVARHRIAAEADAIFAAKNFSSGAMPCPNLAFDFGQCAMRESVSAINSMSVGNFNAVREQRFGSQNADFGKIFD
jgi:hypothetical protein